MTITKVTASCGLASLSLSVFLLAIYGCGERATLEPVTTETAHFSTPLRLTDDVMYVHEVQDVTFTIGIISDQVDVVTLYSTDRNGTVLSELGTCKDDGVRPDEIANDTIYTIKRSLTPSEKGFSHFKVGVIETDGDDYYSETRHVLVTARLTNAQITKAVDLANTAADSYVQSVNSGRTLQQAAEDVVNQLANDPGIRNIAATDGGGVSWLTTVGILGGYHPAAYDQQDPGTVPILPTGHTPIDRSSSVERRARPTDMSTAVVLESNRAVIISPYIRHASQSDPGRNPDFGTNDNYYTGWNTIKESNSCKLRAAEERINDDNPFWSLRMFKELSGFGYIHICTHGWALYNGIASWYEDDWTGEPSFGGLNVLSTGIRLAKGPHGTYDTAEYDEDLQARRLAVYPDGTLVILPDFIRKYVTNLSRNSIVYLSACYSMLSDALADAFLDAGAGVVIGFRGVAMIGTSGEVAEAFTGALLGDKNIKTAHELAQRVIAIRRSGLPIGDDLMLKEKSDGYDQAVLSTEWCDDLGFELLWYENNTQDRITTGFENAYVQLSGNTSTLSISWNKPAPSGSWTSVSEASMIRVRDISTFGPFDNRKRYGIEGEPASNRPWERMTISPPVAFGDYFVENAQVLWDIRTQHYPCYREGHMRLVLAPNTIPSMAMMMPLMGGMAT